MLVVKIFVKFDSALGCCRCDEMINFLRWKSKRLFDSTFAAVDPKRSLRTRSMEQEGLYAKSPPILSLL